MYTALRSLKTKGFSSTASNHKSHLLFTRLPNSSSSCRAVSSVEPWVTPGAVDTSLGTGVELTLSGNGVWVGVSCGSVLPDIGVICGPAILDLGVSVIELTVDAVPKRMIKIKDTAHLWEKIPMRHISILCGTRGTATCTSSWNWNNSRWCAAFKNQRWTQSYQLMSVKSTSTVICSYTIPRHYHLNLKVW